MAPAAAAAAHAGKDQSHKQMKQKEKKSDRKKQQAQQLAEELRAAKALAQAGAAIDDLLAGYPPAFSSFASPKGAGLLRAALAFKRGDQLTRAERDAVWALFEANMRGIYEADHGGRWAPGEKRRELFHEDARYVLAFSVQQQDEGAAAAQGQAQEQQQPPTEQQQPQEQQPAEQQQLLGFVHFRFEVEENALVEEELAAHGLGRYSPVLYCYELQLAPAAHRKGLGRRLMQLLELVALRQRLDCVLLTVQRSNDAAAAFYAAAAYQQHPSCPARNGFEDFDGVDPGHRILWKDLRRRR